MALPAMSLSLNGTIQSAMKVQEFCKSIKNATKELSERALQVEVYSADICAQTKFLDQVSPLLVIEHRQLYTKTLKEARLKLEDVNKKLVEFQTLIEQGEREKDTKINSSQSKDVLSSSANYAMRKKAIDLAISELKKWQQTADVCWRLTRRMDSDIIHQMRKEMSAAPKSIRDNMLNARALLQSRQTKETAFLPPWRLANGTSISMLPFCVARLLTKGTGSFIVDTVVSASPSTSVQQTVIHDVENLAKDLREIKSSFGLLQCKGVVENEPSKQKSEGQTFDLVFKMPPNLQNPQSLRSALLGREKPHTLSDVVRLGLEMAKSVSFVHSLNFVHKSIRPEAILVFQEPSTNSLAPFLVGFEKFREHQGDSARIGSEDWKLNMYAHPKRYGLRAEDSYVMQHDIYSLGVCLLEIGLWESFISYEKPEDPPTMSGLLAHSRHIATSQGSTFFKKQFLTLASESLPARMGTRYAKVVETCLTCLDEDNGDFGDEWEFQDSNGILVGVRYIEKVITQLDEIQV